MASTNISFSVEKQLAPHIKELDFDVESYEYGLRIMGVAKEWVDGHSVRFAYSEDPYTKGIAGWLGDTYTLGHYYPYKKEITLFPRTIAHSLKQAMGKKSYERYQSEQGNTLSALTNYVLRHETGHMADYARTDLLSDMAFHDEKRVAFSKFMTKTGVAAIAGAVLGSELAEYTDVQPAVGSAIGLVFAGGVMGLFALREASGNIKEFGERSQQQEAAAEAFAEDFAVQALLGNVVQIELKK